MVARLRVMELLQTDKLDPSDLVPQVRTIQSFHKTVPHRSTTFCSVWEAVEERSTMFTKVRDVVDLRAYHHCEAKVIVDHCGFTNHD